MTKERREDIQTYSAIGMLIAGVLFAAAGFVTPPIGQIHDSVLWIAAQCFIYAGSALGIVTYMHGKVASIRKDLKLPPETEE